jgi:hypothetical protein
VVDTRRDRLGGWFDVVICSIPWQIVARDGAGMQCAE